MTLHGGRAVQYSNWNGFYLTTKAGTDKLEEDLLQKRRRVVWMTLLCFTQRAQQSQSRSKFYRIQVNIQSVFLRLVDWCETILAQMWGSTSLGRGGVFSKLEEQFRSGRTPGCQWVTSLMEMSHQNPGTLSVHIVVGQICCVPDDVFMIILVKHWRTTIAVHTALRQDSCERDHQGGILETNSHIVVLFSDG